MNGQSEVYECSRSTAKVQKSTSNWINEFSEGIKLNKGDSVRLLGSFVHEGSSGEEIQLTEDTALNINFSPFVQLNTLDTNDKTNPTLIDLGRVADIPYSTDAFGVEPLFWNTPDSDQQAQTGIANYQYPINNTSDPIATGTQDNRTFGINQTKWNSRTTSDPTLANPNAPLNARESAKVWGMNIKTDIATQPTQRPQNYKNFTFNNIPQELYLAQMVKKIILPFMDGIYFNNPNGLVGTGNPADPIANRFHQFPILNDNPPLAGPGMLNGVPRPGFCIATVNLGGSAGWFDENGKGYFENRWDNTAPDGDDGAGGFIHNQTNRYIGIPNLKSGVESVIGTILAVRPIYHNIAGRRTGCYECYVSNFVNPASVSNKKIQHTFPAGHITSATNTQTGVEGTTAVGGLPQITLFKQIHGSGINKNNYNINPTLNNINGSDNDYNSTLGDQGCYIGCPLQMNYSGDAGCGNYEQNVLTGATTQTPDEYEVGYGQPQGLSNLWNGSHQGSLRWNFPLGNESAYLGRRLNYNQDWATFGNAPPSHPNEGLPGIWAKIGGNDGAPDPDTGSPQQSAVEVRALGLVPMCIGGYIICQKETMEDIAKGTYDTLDDPNFYSGFANQTPRVWFEYSYQQTESKNYTRHYKYNSWVNNDADPQLGPTGQAQAIDDVRHNYTFCGQPKSICFRASRGSPEQLTYTSGPTQGFLPPGCLNSNPELLPLTQPNDLMPRYYSSITGFPEFAQTNNQPGNALKGVPYVSGIYNNTINSTHFQQKETGDCDLGRNNLRASGFTHSATNPGTTIQITKASLNYIEGGNGLFTPMITDHIKINYATEAYPSLAATYHDTVEIINVVDGGLFWTLTFATGNALAIGGDPSVGGGTPVGAQQPVSSGQILVAVPINTPVFINRGGSYLGPGYGVNAEAWCSDLLMIKESMAKITVEKGFYTEEQLAEKINNQLHLNNINYAQDYGVRQADNKFSIPATTSGIDTALTSVPSIFNGNFLQTYIPDLSFAFSPITQNASTNTELQASTKDMTSEIYDYLQYKGGNGNRQFYYSEHISTDRPTTDINVKPITDLNAGKHFKLYSPPLVTGAGIFDPQIQCVRLRGGALNKNDWDTTNNVWKNQTSRWVGSYEALRDNKGNVAGASSPPSQHPIYAYRTRLVRNLLSWGGSSKLFCGANNITFSWEQGANRFSLNNLYTPIRPHEPINPANTQNDFGIDDAVPSAIINARHTGATAGQLTGVYINELNGDSFNFINWGAAPPGTEWKYDTLGDEEIQANGKLLLDALGYSSEQLLTVNNSFNIVNDIFIFRDYQLFYNQAIRVAPKLSTAINGSNPFASNCLNIAPITQFFVECETNDFFAINVPSKGNDPYYFIGSDFPSKYFYGNSEGQKLPVIGICSRNFHSFNFVFDLGGSSVNFVVQENVTIKSIETKIYNSTMGEPQSLSPFSSIIYLVTRNNFAPSLNGPELEQALEIADNNKQPVPMVGEFYSQPMSNFAFPPAITPSNWNQPAGEMPPLMEDTDSDEY